MALQIPSTYITLPSSGNGGNNNNNNSFTLKGRSRAGDGTTFLVQELKLMFDMGAIVHQACPDIVFLTHTHSDHIAFMPQILTGKTKCTDVYLPAKALPFVEQYLQAHQALIGCGEEPEDEDDPKQFYKLHPLDFGDVLSLKIKGVDYTVTALKCEHRIDCLGFSIFRQTRSLKPEYRELTGREIGALRKEGTQIHDIEEYPFLCYLGDTTHGVFDNHPEILQQHKYIVVECSFICDKSREKARKSKHMHWDNLKPIVESNANVLFILIHFSLRYSAIELRQFFVKETQSTCNVHPMLVQSELRPQHFGRQHHQQQRNNHKVPRCNCFHCQEQFDLQKEQAKRPANDDNDNDEDDDGSNNHRRHHSKQSRHGRHHGRRRDNNNHSNNTNKRRGRSRNANNRNDEDS